MADDSKKCIQKTLNTKTDYRTTKAVREALSPFLYSGLIPPHPIFSVIISPTFSENLTV